MNAALAFESEWMEDGTLRLRFLDADGAILGQQIIATQGLVAIQLLISLAVVKTCDADRQDVLSEFRLTGLNVDLADATSFLESRRTRAAIMPDGNVEFTAIDEDDEDDVCL